MRPALRSAHRPRPEPASARMAPSTSLHIGRGLGRTRQTVLGEPGGGLPQVRRARSVAPCTCICASAAGVPGTATASAPSSGMARQDPCRGRTPGCRRRVRIRSRRSSTPGRRAPARSRRRHHRFRTGREGPTTRPRPWPASRRSRCHRRQHPGAGEAGRGMAGADHAASRQRRRSRRCQHHAPCAATRPHRDVTGFDADEDLAVALLHRIGLDGFGCGRADRLPGLQVESAAVARTADAVVDQFARRQQAIQMGAVVRRGVRLAIEAGHRELVLAGIEAPYYALGHLPRSGDSLEFHWTLRTFVAKRLG